MDFQVYCEVQHWDYLVGFTQTQRFSAPALVHIAGQSLNVQNNGFFQKKK